MKKEKKNIIKEHGKVIAVMVVILSLINVFASNDFKEVIASIEVKKEEIEEEKFLRLEEEKIGSIIIAGEIYKPYNELLGSKTSETEYETKERTSNDEIVQMGQEVLNVNDDKVTVMIGNHEGSKSPFRNVELEENSEIFVTDYSGEKKSYYVTKILDVNNEEDMDVYNDTLDGYKDSEAIVIVFLGDNQTAFFAEPK